jgi:pilus assembly protein FimV
VSQLADQAAGLYSQQAASARALQSATGAGALGQRQLAEQKRQLSSAVRQLGDAIGAAADRYRRDAPAMASALRAAQGTITGTDLANRLDIDAQYLDQGAGRAIASTDAAVTQSLGEVNRQLQAAAAGATPSQLAGAGRADALGQELARLRALRGQLARAADAAQSGGTRGAAGSPGRQGTQGTQGPQGAPGAVGTQAPAGTVASAEAQRTLTAQGALGAQGTVGTPGGALSPGAAGREMRAVAAGAAGLMPALAAQGADQRSLNTVARLSRQLGEASAPLSGRADDVAQLRAQVDMLDALELQLEQRASAAGSIRGDSADRGAEQYQRAVAEYFRQLSRQ